MTAITSDLISICRMFMVFERNFVCCGEVTVQQCVALQELLEGDADVSSLSANSGVSISAMTRLLDGLERRGFVERLRDDSDRRRVVARLTPTGRKEAERLRTLTDEAVQRVLAHVPKAKHKQVLSTMRLVREAMTNARDDFEGE